MLSLPTSITISTGQGAKPIIEMYSVNFNTTPNILIEHFFKIGVLPDRNFTLFEVRQHEKILDNLIALFRIVERFIRKLMFDELLIVLLFNWNLSSHQFSLVIRKEVQSIYLDLRRELCRSLPLEKLLQRQLVVQTAEDDAINAIGKRVELQKKLIRKRLQDLR